MPGGTYQVSARAGSSNLPSGEVILNPALVVSGNTTGLALNVVAPTVSGTVTHNGSAPVAVSPCSGSGVNTSFNRARVLFTTAAGKVTSLDVQNCGSTPGIISGAVAPGTYRVSVRGMFSDIPGADVVLVERLAVR